MKRKRFSEERKITFIKESEGGMADADLIRPHGMADETFYRGKAK
ncbi:MAG: transposase [Nitrospirae bacterium]|nr:transposase [Nitrospirota bacterium]